MKRKIDIGEDKNFFEVDPKAINKPQPSFLMDDLPKTAEDTLQEARKLAWGNWINSEPLIMGYVDDEGQAYMFPISETLKNRVVLIDFWEYTLPPSRRSLSYVLEWHRRYSPAGMITIGIHSPLFEFGKDKRHILDAVRELNITYPVVLDNGYELWRSLENRYWPRRILLDPAGKIQADYVGEEGYREMEEHIQILLRGLSPGLACPPLMKFARAIDNPNYKTPEVTPEIFFGTKRNAVIGNLLKPVSSTDEALYSEKNMTHQPHLPYFEGPWTATAESMFGSYGNKNEVHFTINFTGSDVFIVARSRPRSSSDIPQMARVQVLIDKKPILDDNLGNHSNLNEFRRTIVTVRDPNLYHVATRLDGNPHEFTILIDADASATDTLELYAVFFEHRA